MGLFLYYLGLYLVIVTFLEQKKNFSKAHAQRASTQDASEKSGLLNSDLIAKHLDANVNNSYTSELGKDQASVTLAYEWSRV